MFEQQQQHGKNKRDKAAIKQAGEVRSERVYLAMPFFSAWLNGVSSLGDTSVSIVADGVATASSSRSSFSSIWTGTVAADGRFADATSSSADTREDKLKLRTRLNGCLKTRCWAYARAGLRIAQSAGKRLCNAAART